MEECGTEIIECSKCKAVLNGKNLIIRAEGDDTKIVCWKCGGNPPIDEDEEE